MRKFIYRTFLGVNILFAFALILSYLSVHINPDTIALLALFGLAYPYLLLINLIFAILWAVALKWEALISVVVIAAGFTHFSNYLKIQKPSGDKTGTFQVQSYNVRLFNYFEGRKSSNSEKRILELLKNQKADIICLQELYIMGDPEQKEREIKSALGGKYYSHFKVIGTGKNRYYGIATLSKFPITARGDIVHEKSSSLSIYSDILAGKDTIRIFNNHLQSFRLHMMERTFLNELTESSDDKETINEIISISTSLRKGFVKRASQAQAVKVQINKSCYPVIVAGDFNDTPVSFSYRKIRKGLNDAFVSSGYGAGFTYRGNYPPNRIDYILYDDAIECRQFNIVKAKYSDHYPIVAYFRKKN
ncbi:MAG: endonuclease/exonuclease/phosphatase family protein [Bacteroidia bacterium]|nr:endonuclease/exonuclease/phosphatase family protein [Bacteroidia bacterium]